MRIGIIVSDFPKVTETFILRDLVHNHGAGHEMRIFHLTPYRNNEVVHGFAEKTLDWVVSIPFILDTRVLGALLRALTHQPLAVFRIVRQIISEFKREPSHMLKALAIVPKSLAIAENLKAWNAGHIHAEFAGHPGTSAWIIARMIGTPYSVSCHAHDIFRTQGLLAQKLDEASFVRCISEFNKRFLIERFPSLSEHALPVIHVGVDTEKIQALPPAVSDQLQILFIGSMEYRKGVSVLLKALSDMPAAINWHCNIVGGGPEHTALQQQSSALQLNDRVTFHGPQPFETVSAFMRECAVLVVPSIEGPGGRSEGIPTVIIEALAHQRPVIASRLSGIPELVVDKETGYLIEPGNVAQLTAALVAIHKHPNDAFKTAVQGRQVIEKEFDMKTNAEARLQLYLKYASTS